MRTFEVIYTDQPRRNRKFKVRGVCEFDVLNPCWDNRPSDIPGTHWGDKNVKSCPACAKTARSTATR